MYVFVVGVEFSTFDGLKAKEPFGLQFASVLAGSDVEAELVAAQLVACRGVIPVGTTVLDVLDY